MANIPPEFLMPQLTMRLRDFLGQRKKNATSRERGSTEYTLSRFGLLLSIACIIGHTWKYGEQATSRVTSQVYGNLQDGLYRGITNDEARERLKDTLRTVTNVIRRSTPQHLLHDLHVARAFGTDEKYMPIAIRQVEYCDNDEEVGSMDSYISRTVGNRPIEIGKCLMIRDCSRTLRGVINSSCDRADHKVTDEDRSTTCMLYSECSVSSTYKPSDTMKIAGAIDDMVRVLMRNGAVDISIHRAAGLSYTVQTCAHDTRLERRGASQCRYITKPDDRRYIDSDDFEFSLFTGTVRTCEAFGFESEDANLSTEDVSFGCSNYREHDAPRNFHMSHDTSNIRPLKIMHIGHIYSETGKSLQGSYKHCYGMGYCYVIPSISIDRGVSGFQSYVQIYWYAIWISIEYLEVSSHLDRKDSIKRRIPTGYGANHHLLPKDLIREK